MLLVEYAFENFNSVKVFVHRNMGVDEIYACKPRALQEGESELPPMRVPAHCLSTHFSSLSIHSSFLWNPSPSYHFCFDSCHESELYVREVDRPWERKRSISWALDICLQQTVRKAHCILIASLFFLAPMWVESQRVMLVVLGSFVLPLLSIFSHQHGVVKLSIESQSQDRSGGSSPLCASSLDFCLNLLWWLTPLETTPSSLAIIFHMKILVFYSPNNQCSFFPLIRSQLIHVLSTLSNFVTKRSHQIFITHSPKISCLNH